MRRIDRIKTPVGVPENSRRPAVLPIIPVAHDGLRGLAPQAKTEDRHPGVPFVSSNHCRAVGRPLFGEIEPDQNPLKVDHVWLMLDVGKEPPMKLAINTISIRNRDAGFDSRIRVGTYREPYETLPEVGLFPHPGLDYGQYELEHNVFYEHYEHHAMEALLIDKIGTAILVEVWGELYTRHAVGIHQIHCRRASCAVPQDLIGRDGALKFFFAKDNLCEMLLFKFCGQP